MKRTFTLLLTLALLLSLLLGCQTATVPASNTNEGTTTADVTETETTTTEEPTTEEETLDEFGAPAWFYEPTEGYKEDLRLPDVEKGEFRDDTIHCATSGKYNEVTLVQGMFEKYGVISVTEIMHTDCRVYTLTLNQHSKQNVLDIIQQMHDELPFLCDISVSAIRHPQVITAPINEPDNAGSSVSII